MREEEEEELCQRRVKPKRRSKKTWKKGKNVEIITEALAEHKYSQSFARITWKKCGNFFSYSFFSFFLPDMKQEAIGDEKEKRDVKQDQIICSYKLHQICK